MSGKPTIRADWDNGEGTVRFPPSWRQGAAITRADILMDWIEKFTTEYNVAVEELNTLPPRKDA